MELKSTQNTQINLKILPPMLNPSQRKSPKSGSFKNKLNKFNLLILMLKMGKMFIEKTILRL